MQQHGWSLLPEHEAIAAGSSGARLDRPALDRLRDAARRGACDAVVLLSPDRLARNSAHQGLLIEECEKGNTPLSFLQKPFGDTPQGKLLPQMPGRIAEYERAQMAARPRRGRLAKARHGACMPWAYSGYGYGALPKRHGCAPQVRIEPAEAEVVRDIARALVEDHLSCRQSPKRLHVAKTPTPTGQNHVWQPAPVRTILTTRVSAGQARDTDRQPVIPPYRQTAAPQRRDLKTGRSDRAESEWMWSEAPAILTVERCDTAPRPLQRTAAAARKMSQPASRRYWLRTLVTGGAGGLGMVCIRHLSACKKSP